MTLEGLRTRTSEDCVSDRRLDALLAGELEGEALAGVEAHLTGCLRCAARRATLAEDAGAFLAAHPKAAPRRPRSLKPPRARLLWWSTGLAAAAAMWLFMRAPEGTVRTKGSGSVGFFVRHGEKVRRGVPGERVQPGDALRFVVSQREPSYVAVLSRDAAGQASVYYPAAARAQRVDAGVERALDTSVILDDVLGTEQVYALRCRQPIELLPLREKLALTPAEPAFPEACEIERFTLQKVWPP